MILRLASLSLLASVSFAQTTVYVDGVNGSNAATGADPDNAVRTITRGLQIIEHGGDVPGSAVIVAAGDYAPALGEIMPLRLSPGVSMFATGDARVTGLGVQSNAAVVFARPGPPAFPTHVEGFHLRDAPRGVQTAPLIAGHLVVAGCTIEDSTTGIDVLAGNDVSYVIEDCTVANCVNGISVEAVPQIDIRSTRVTGFSSSGIVIRDVDVADIDATVQGIGDGTAVAVFGLTRPVNVTFSGALLDCNTGVSTTSFGAQTASFAATHATIAGNTFGVFAAGGSGTSMSIERSIIAENDVDLVGLTPQISVSYTFVPAGFVFGPGVLINDPGLRDPDAGDYSLRRGALAIDGFNVATSIEAEDGNLDTIARRDYGGFEYHALRATNDATIGSSYELEVDGLAGEYAVGILDRHANPASPIDTTSGRFDLNPAFAARVARIPIDPVTGVGDWQLDIPNVPSLAGVTWNVQALSRSALSPTGFAFTNSIEFTIR